MIKVLVVEDDDEKFAHIDAALRADPDWQILISRAGSVWTAVRALEITSFDIVVLDLALPMREGSKILIDGGLRVLQEIDGPRPLRHPSHIIGLTAFPELRDSALDHFASRLFSLLDFDIAVTAWQEQLSGLVAHVGKAQSDAVPTIREYEYLLAIVCALDTPELSALRKVNWGWKQLAVAHDDSIYFTGVIPGAHQCRVVASAAGQMGTAAAAVLAAKMTEIFRPQYLAMTGIAAAVSRKECNVGDVLVADSCWEWAAGKFASGKSGSRFLASPRQLQLSIGLSGKFARLAESAMILEGIRSEWVGDSPDCLLKVRVGPLATGPAVVADSTLVAQIVSQHRKVLGIDMEAYAIFAAAENAREPRPLPFVMKSVVDFADSRKTDDYHAFAAYTSSRALAAFVETFLLKP